MTHMILILTGVALFLAAFVCLIGFTKGRYDYNITSLITMVLSFIGMIAFAMDFHCYKEFQMKGSFIHANAIGASIVFVVTYGISFWMDLRKTNIVIAITAGIFRLGFSFLVVFAIMCFLMGGKKEGTR